MVTFTYTGFVKFKCVKCFVCSAYRTYYTQFKNSSLASKYSPTNALAVVPCSNPRFGESRRTRYMIGSA